jgi:hypothetical protein
MGSKTADIFYWKTAVHVEKGIRKLKIARREGGKE